MQRLRELQIVTVTPPAPAQAHICRIVMIDGGQALLLTRESVQAAFQRDCMLTFDFEGQTIGLVGHCRRGDSDHELQFAVSDGVQIPRRERSRLTIALDANIAPVDAQGNAVGETWPAKTVDLSSKGMLVGPAQGLRAGDRVRLLLHLPEREDAISATAQVVRLAQGAAGVTFTVISDEDRRLVTGVIRDGKRRLATQI